MRLGLLTCAWKRPELTKVVLDHSASASRAVKFVCVDTFGPGLAGIFGHPWTILNNRNVIGEKFNTGLWFLRSLDLDAVMILGTDDLLSEQIFRMARIHIEDGYDWFGLIDCYVYHAASEEMRYWPGYRGEREGETIGTARTFSRRYLDAHDWKLWPDDATVGLDGFSNPARSDFKGVAMTMAECKGAVIDVKAYPGIDLGSAWAFDGARTVPRDEAFQYFPEDIVGSVIQLPSTIARAARNPSPNGVAEPPLISACIIARDAAETIGRCLFTAKRICQECVVVVDDRTTDDTAAIAEKHGAKVVLRRFTNFSEQRNAALAAATGEWRFILDSDEWLEDPGDLERACRDVPAEINVINCMWGTTGSINFIENTVQARLIRRGLTYRFPAHHALVGVKGTATVKGLILEKYEKADVEKGARRAIEILTPLLDGDADEKRHALHYIARSHAALGDYAKAAEFCMKLAKLEPTDVGNWGLWIACLERSPGMLDWTFGDVLGQALDLFPDFMDFQWWAMRMHAAKLITLAATGESMSKYVAVPQRTMRYLPLISTIGPFLMMQFGPQEKVESKA